jgi:hypothetical protein
VLVGHDDLATITLYITHNIRRPGDPGLDLDPPGKQLTRVPGKSSWAGFQAVDAVIKQKQ